MGSAPRFGGSLRVLVSPGNKSQRRRGHAVKVEAAVDDPDQDEGSLGVTLKINPTLNRSTDDDECYSHQLWTQSLS